MTKTTGNITAKNLSNTTPNSATASTKGATAVPANATSGNATSRSAAPSDGVMSGTHSTLVAGRDVHGFQIKPPMIDVRGWDVMLANGIKLGIVDRIMLDATTKTPRYLAIKPSDRSGHLLVPIGFGKLEQAGRQVVLKGLSSEALQSLPILTSDAVTGDFERKVFSAVTGRQPTADALPQLYTDPLYDPMRLFQPSAAAAHS